MAPGSYFSDKNIDFNEKLHGGLPHDVKYTFVKKLFSKIQFIVNFRIEENTN